MSDKVLSQAEVETLLSELDPVTPAPESADAAPHQQPASYDLKRQGHVGAGQMRALRTLHEGFARNFGEALSALLRRAVEVSLTSVEQLNYGEFVFRLENPTCFNLLRADPLVGELILEMTPSILYPIIDRLLGGGSECGPLTRRPLTEIELRIVTKITDLFLDELKRAWRRLLVLDLKVARVESNPRLARTMSPNESLALIKFELRLGDLRGVLNLGVPFRSLERIGDKLATNSSANAAPADVAELVVELADSTISTHDLAGLRVGDIVTTEKDVHAALVVKVDGRRKFFAHPGAYQSARAIRIEGAIEPGDDGTI